MEVDFQFFFNSMAGVIAFFGGWVLKAFWERIKEVEQETDHLRDHHETEPERGPSTAQPTSLSSA